MSGSGGYRAMTRAILRSLAVAATLACCAGAAATGQGDPTPRKDIDPGDKAKVTGIEAKRWTLGRDEVKRTDTVSGNVPGKRSCTTNVGAAPPPPGRELRFGPQPKSQTVVVTGSVINVCK